MTQGSSLLATAGLGEGTPSGFSDGVEPVEPSTPAGRVERAGSLGLAVVTEQRARTSELPSELRHPSKSGNWAGAPRGDAEAGGGAISPLLCVTPQPSGRILYTRQESPDCQSCCDALFEVVELGSADHPGPAELTRGYKLGPLKGQVKRSRTRRWWGPVPHRILRSGVRSSLNYRIE